MAGTMRLAGDSGGDESAERYLFSPHNELPDTPPAVESGVSRLSDGLRLCFAHPHQIDIDCQTWSPERGGRLWIWRGAGRGAKRRPNGSGAAPPDRGQRRGAVHLRSPPANGQTPLKVVPGPTMGETRWE